MLVQYKKYHEIALQSVEDVLNIVNDVDYETKKGWKLENDHKDGVKSRTWSRPWRDGKLYCVDVSIIMVLITFSLE